MQTNIYAEKENGDLKLIAEIEGLEDPALAVDALLDEMPRLKQRDFVVINLDSVMHVEAGEEIVQPRRQITIRGGNNAAAAAPKRRGRPRAAAVEEPEEDNGNGEEPAPAPKRRGRPPGSKNKPKGTARKSSPFRSNPASAE